jgi:hypothetical protein
VDASGGIASLYSVLDEADIALWTKLVRGIEATRDELDALRAAQRSAHGNEYAYGRVLMEADRERDGSPSARASFPAPLSSLHDPDAAPLRQSDPSEGRGAAAYASGAPVIAVSLHSSPYERPEFSSNTADLYAYAQGATAAPTLLFQRRPSPFAVDEAAQVQIRPREHAGTYDERMQQQHPHSSHAPDPSSSLSRSASRARILSSPMRLGASLGPSSSAQASPSVRPYESWLRAEMQQAATPSDAPPHLTPGRFGSAAASLSMHAPNANLLPSSSRSFAAR